MLKLYDLTVENQFNPVGLSEKKPRFSWKLKSTKDNTYQVAYKILVYKRNKQIWNSKKITSSKSVFVDYNGEELEPTTEYHVTVIVWDNYHEEALIKGTFETNLLSYKNIKADWITSSNEDSEIPPVFYQTFNIDKKVSKARIYASSLGIYEIELNGKKVGKEYFTPGWTNYNRRIQYQTYDITKHIREKNKVEITVANGWYKGILGFDLESNHYGNNLATIAEIHLTFDDGKKEIIKTNEKWKVTEGKIRYAELYKGEIIDHTAGSTDTRAVKIFDYDKSLLIGQENEPVRIIEKLNVIEKIKTPKGETVLDFGQNLTGVVELTTEQEKGKEIVIRHAEVLDKDGNFYPDTLREATSIDRFICGGKKETFKPRFTFHGFRYISIEGLDFDEVNPEDLTACVMHSDMKQTGEFTTSHKEATQLQSNIRWGQRGNFLDIPTDCPQRDERLGWTGDAQIFARTATFNYDVSLFFRKWLKDLKSEQSREHGVPHVIPDILGIKEGAAVWSDAATIVPWTLYQVYGDKRILEEQYESMKDWVEYIRQKIGDNYLWQSGFQYGDWLALDKEEIAEGNTGATDVYFISSVFFAYSTDLVAKAAKVLGKERDEEKYRKLHKKIIENFNEEYVTKTGRLVSETQTATVLALNFNMIQEKHRERVLSALEKNLAKHKNHLTTGFVGTPYIAHALSDNGRHDLAGELLLKDDYPSWLYAVRLGATTIWERWNSIHEDGSFDESGMNSLNHYAYGSIGDWMYQQLGGLQILEPGYKKSLITPKFIKGITHAKASLETNYGKLACEWRCENRKITVAIQVPENTIAVVKLPEKDETFEIGSGKYEYCYATDTVLELEKYSMDITLGELVKVPKAVELLNQMMPDILDNPMVKYAYGQTIAEMTSLMPREAKELFEIIITKLNNFEQ